MFEPFESGSLFRLALRRSGGSILSFLRRTRQVASVVRLSPWDVMSPEGRARERLRRLILTVLAGVAAKVVALASMVISIPWTLHYLKSERYGLWMAISSVVAMMGFADFGVGNGLMNAIAEAYGEDDRDAARRYVTSGFIVLTGIALALLALFAASYPFVRWGSLFNVATAGATREAGPAMAVFVSCFALSMPLGLVQRVQLGYQEGFQSNLWQCCGSLLGLVAIAGCIRFRLDLPYLVLAVSGSPVVILLANNLVYFSRHRPDLRPRWGHWSRPAASKIFRVGIMFFALQVTAALVYSSDNFVAARILGAPSVVEYSIAQRLFAVIPIVAGLALQPLWPAYGEAISRGDSTWIRRTLVRSLITSFALTVPLALTLSFLNRQLLHLLKLGEIEIDRSLVAGMATWSIVGTLGSTMSMFLNGANFVRFQVLCSLAFVATAVPAKVACARLFGTPGIIWSTNLTYIFIVIIPYAFIVMKILK